MAAGNSGTQDVSESLVDPRFQAAVPGGLLARDAIQGAKRGDSPSGFGSAPAGVADPVKQPAMKATPTNVFVAIRRYCIAMSSSFLISRETLLMFW